MTDQTTLATDTPVWKDGVISHRGTQLVPVSEWLASNRDVDTAPLLEAGDQVEPLVQELNGDLSGVPIIALAFPSFADGRAYSKAQLLRDAHGFEGEIRAVGDVLPDQIELMLRVGFDALEATHPVTRERMEAGQIDQDVRHMQIAPASEDEKPAGRFSWRRYG
ncbi:MAG: DUF934 domain-containing protein [Pseudomonadota bacterium]